MTLLVRTLWERQHQSTPAVLMFLFIEVQTVLEIDYIAMTGFAIVHNILEKKLFEVPH